MNGRSPMEEERALKCKLTTEGVHLCVNGPREESGFVRYILEYLP